MTVVKFFCLNGKAPAVVLFPYEFTGHSWSVAVHNPDDQ